LTIDHAVLINLFNGVNYGLIDDGTAIGLGLANAVNRIKDSKAKSKVIILLTDGSNNCGDIAPITAAEIAKTFGIRIYTIGVGTTGIVNIPVPTPMGTQYQRVQSDFDAKSLKEIANLTGGKYFNATDNSKLRHIYQSIDQLEKTKISVHEFSKKDEQFYVFSILAFIFLTLEILIRNTILRRIP
jgi:Ca-activated chloride channel homolog